MLVDDIGDVTITNDGATILKQLEVEHPDAKVKHKNVIIMKNTITHKTVFKQSKSEYVFFDREQRTIQTIKSYREVGNLWKGGLFMFCWHLPSIYFWQFPFLRVNVPIYFLYNSNISYIVLVFAYVFVLLPMNFLLISASNIFGCPVEFRKHTNTYQAPRGRASSRKSSRGARKPPGVPVCYVVAMCFISSFKGTNRHLLLIGTTPPLGGI